MIHEEQQCLLPSLPASPFAAMGQEAVKVGSALASHATVVLLKSQEKQEGAMRNDEKQEEVRTSKEKP